MKLNELKCKNCGAKLSVPEKTETVTCKYCHTTFSVEDAYTEGYKYTKGVLDAHDEKQKEQFERVKDFMENNPVAKKSMVAGKIVSIFSIIIIVAVFIGIFFGISKTIKSDKEWDKEWEVTKFNNGFLNYNGTKSGYWVKDYLDDIVDSNKTNKSHIITVVYNDIKTSDSTEIINMKKSIDENKKYEVIVDYDENGFFYLMTIEE